MYFTSELKNLYIHGAMSLKTYFQLKKIILKRYIRKTKKTFNLKSISEDDCVKFFRFYREDLYRLAKALEVPHTMRTSRQTMFSGKYE